MTDAEQLITSNIRLVHYMVNRLGKSEFVRQNWDDLTSEGMVGLIKAARAFDPAKGVKFATFASRCVNNQLLMYIRRNKKHEGNISLYAPICGDTEGNELFLVDMIADKNSELDKVIRAVEAVSDLEHLTTMLTEREKQIVKYLQAEMKQKEIAKLIGVTQSYASRLICKIRKKYKKMIERYNCG